jgi:halimadienyl-diphosphate synthase
MNIEEEVQRLLKEVGPGNMSSTAYDTAWVARMVEIEPELSNEALQWICENQLDNGSWGARDISYYHDRVISTLAAMISLTYRGRRAQDKIQIERGLKALEQITSGATQGLASDPNGATVGFEMIVPSLVAEAENLGIIKQQGDRILGRMKYLRGKKMQKLAGMKINRHNTPAFSAEMAGADGQNILDVENLQESNGSVANSPSATAYFTNKIIIGEERALNYLKETITNRHGGAPFASPFNIFERAWVLWNISITPLLMNDSKIRQAMLPHIQFLQQAWKPNSGVGFSNEYTPCDGDDTSVTYDVLARFDQAPELQTLLNYEDEKFFRCYHLEVNPSIGANIHMLGALQRAGLENKHSAIIKILDFLTKTCQPEGYWTDKWHISPYYTTSHAIIVCKDLDQSLCQNAIEWILNTQNSNGSWGSFGKSTAEETAYSLQALNIWKQHGNNIPQQVIHSAVQWLKHQGNLSHPPLWISKALYCPYLVVESTILSALALCEESL